VTAIVELDDLQRDTENHIFEHKKDPVTFDCFDACRDFNKKFGPPAETSSSSDSDDSDNDNDCNSDRDCDNDRDRDGDNDGDSDNDGYDSDSIIIF
jgi:hypothetical protein